MATMVQLKVSSSYSKNLYWWRLFDDFVDGSKASVSKHLIRYNSETENTKEGRAAFAGRLARAYNENHCKCYLEVHVGHMAQAIDFNLPEGPVWDEIRADATQFGQDSIGIAREMLWDYCQDGIVGVLVDQEAVVPATQGEAAAANSRSYQVRYEAEEILNYEYFRRGPNKGKLSLVLLSNGYASIDGKAYQLLREYRMDESGLVGFIDYRTDAKFTISNDGEITAEAVGVGTIGIRGEIPFVLMGCDAEESLIKDSAEGNAALFNRLSIRDNVNHYQGFQKVIVAGAAPEELSVMNESTITVCQRSEVSVHEIPAGEPAAIERQIMEIRAYLRRVGMKEYNQLADDSKNIQSAESKEKDTKARKELYDQILDLQTEALTKIYRLHGLFEGLSDAEREAISVSITREYGLDDKVQEAAERQQAFSMAATLGVDRVEKELLKAVVSRQRFVATDELDEEEVRAECYAAIDEAQPGSAIANRFGGQAPAPGASPNGRPDLTSLLTQ